jgi:hypothetical protein
MAELPLTESSGSVTLPTGEKIAARKDETGKWSFHCPGCNKIGRLGMTCNQHNATQHWISKACIKDRKQILQQQRLENLQAHPSIPDPTIYHPNSRAAELMERQRLQIQTQTFSSSLISSPSFMGELTPISEAMTPTTAAPMSAFADDWGPSYPSYLSSRESVGPSASTYPCPGFRASFPSIYSDYAFAAHDKRTLRWEPLTFNSESNEIIFRSKTCQDTVTLGVSCIPCLTTAASPQFQNFLSRAELSTEDHSHTSYDLLTHNQMDSLAHALGDVARKALSHVSKPCFLSFLMNN